MISGSNLLTQRRTTSRFATMPRRAAPRHQRLDIADAEGEAEIQPHGVPDRVGQEPVTLKRDRPHRFFRMRP
ncbi:MAG: hypothetical protein ACKVSF_07695 [Alphaproteobacteria bacterium]